MTDAPRVLILGADGFIGRHIAFALRDAGWHVIAHARRTSALAQMGFETLQADLTNPACHVPTFWADTLHSNTHVINAAGLLTGNNQTFQAVHVTAPGAVYAAMGAQARGVLISAIGIEADTRFARWRRAGEKAAPEQIAILRPGLVLGHTSYGGSSLARALAALPLATPVVGDGSQVFNPMHATDLAAIAAQALTNPPTSQGPHSIGGPEDITQAGLSQLLRGWMGLRPVPTLKLPLWVANFLGRIGDVLRLGPISRTAVTQLAHGVHAPPTLGPQARPVSTFVMAQPAGTQDIWHARLYLLRPVLRLLLALLWLVSGILGLTLTPDTFLPLIPNSHLPDTALIALARTGGIIDLAIAAALLRGWRLPLMGWAQLAMIGGYTLAFTALAPSLWALPLGGLLKNPALMGLVITWMVLERER